VNAVQINRANISEAFSFSTWQRLHDLGLSDEGITTNRIDLRGRLLSKIVDEDLFKQKLVELGLVVLVVKVFRARTQPVVQTVAIAGPDEAFTELNNWWREQTGRDCPINNYLDRAMSNGFLVKDRWSQAVADGQAIASGAFNELGSKL
jgi:hypothetical protein